MLVIIITKTYVAMFSIRYYQYVMKAVTYFVVCHLLQMLFIAEA